MSNRNPNRTVALEIASGFVSSSSASVATDFEVASGTGLAERAYHELRKNPHFEIDALQRLQSNLLQLEELQGRLQFMMREISSLTSKKSF